MYEFDPAQAVGSALTGYDREQLCRFVIKLCDCVKQDVGAGVYRGGIYPDNISLSDEGELAIGPARKEDWSGQELDFLPPERYWNGRLTPAADVYAIGMLLYFAVTNGTLPFEGQCKDAQLRRMGGEPFPTPAAAGRRLGDIIAKATRFKAAERYQSMDELRALVESCLKNLYLSGASSAESIFKKSDDELSELEQMMVSIIEKGEEEPLPEEEILAEVHKETEQEQLLLPEEEAECEQEEEEFALEDSFVRAVEEDQIYEAELYSEEEYEEEPIPMLFEEKDPELAPVILRKKPEVRPVVQYTREAQKQMMEEADKRKRRPVALILVLCAILVIASIVFNAIIKDITSRPEMNQQTQPVIETPVSVAEITPEPTVIPEVTPLPGGLEETTVPPSEEPVEHRYELFKEDISWSDAKDKCFAMGGHLVVINDEEEYKEVYALANREGVDRMWIGGHRENDQIVWEDGSDSESVYTPWANGEPSRVDSGDGAHEDYVMMWYFNNAWVFNDSRHDPCSEYPHMYAGKMAYVCEFGG